MHSLDMILVVDRHEAARPVVGELRERGCAVRTVLRDDTTPASLATRPDPLVLLAVDEAAPGALAWCRDLRDALPASRICALFASADELRQTVALEMGADTVLVRPVSGHRLAAQLHALSRTVARRPERYRVGDLELVESTREARLDGRPLELTSLEFDLLRLLVRHAGRILSRDDIFRELRGLPHDGRDRSIDLAVVRLRRKLGDDAQRPRYLKTVRGTGYLLADAAS